MEKIKIKETVMSPVNREVDGYCTTDGKEFKSKSTAEFHEYLIKNYPKLSDLDNEFLTFLKEESRINPDRIKKDLGSDNVLLLTTESGGDRPSYELVDPTLPGVTAVIRTLNGRCLGCNNSLYVDGVIYKGESLRFDKDSIGIGRDINEVLK